LRTYYNWAPLALSDFRALVREKVTEVGSQQTGQGVAAWLGQGLESLAAEAAQSCRR